MTKSQSYHLKMPKDAYDVLQKIADDEGRLLADVIREALTEYTTRKGYAVRFKVDRGGDRRSREGSDEEKD